MTKPEYVNHFENLLLYYDVKDYGIISSHFQNHSFSDSKDSTERVQNELKKAMNSFKLRLRLKDMLYIDISYSTPEDIQYQKKSREDWANEYQKVIQKLSGIVGKESFLEDCAKILNRYQLTELGNLILNYGDSITDSSEFFYSLSNLLSKYSEIKNISSEMFFSIVNENEISLVLWKKNECIFVKKEYISKLNLIFTPENDVKFSSSDCDDEDYFIYGRYNAPRSFIANKKIKKLLRILDE
ncbi:hypothetical protein CEP48_00330 [Mergibacter septicus]|uniref:Uncharacterized protein n=1 Tax=Mergibacter septicus TaxID=221402 RepID=A0A8D4IZ50_9PAST|nr:hypothetical protein [Mergibacter septicus]AWX14727.1 hypothetical protein CEP47_00330 [Mergibacter septicus]QDJ13978.1 hypothetical protein CEP48_00330 [Mergibacter septicus]UTU48573.1 hypothetical protein HLL31_07300 [Mergibacter septicus]WMR95798.1 hypothetical protein RDJ12_07700 [Mergibacter septicus]